MRLIYSPKGMYVSIIMHSVKQTGYYHGSISAKYMNPCCIFKHYFIHLLELLLNGKRQEFLLNCDSRKRFVWNLIPLGKAEWKLQRVRKRIWYLQLMISKGGSLIHKSRNRNANSDRFWREIELRYVFPERCTGERFKFIYTSQMNWLLGLRKPPNGKRNSYE